MVDALDKNEEELFQREQMILEDALLTTEVFFIGQRARFTNEERGWLPEDETEAKRVAYYIATNKLLPQELENHPNDRDFVRDIFC
ncbi:hypothetical protein A2803_00785 [Candidatus Woesebacteria bacterium RIFCSPHIGHO2_01_FULL_44_21]|uniref:Uncharacterized protein n=1 Tax=Candidatus Woesebacteria bacterium RIFCSPHIGHO2_01_FULL_44_21 TaxID=1802503 RepID=A0A1F7YXU6_9BACT|nr:MAG: hypothetical protein A2803_00785 [Candidatus Woesebacteria bacterium RIFCSPHIGHO2_01_FULL_44_21]OGM70397.1 MAG: hypothetical protein A2897_01215 [Candidatus Woesebacteria bacterium RIFCSPLOWO2_01_FULL_44_24b]